MAKKTLNSVSTPDGTTMYPVTWDTESGEVYVGGEYAGTASSEKDAQAVANYYSTTLIKNYKPVW